MGVFDRYYDIMSANINARLADSKNVEKDVNTMLRNLKKDYDAARTEKATLLAAEVRLMRKITDIKLERDKLDEYIKKAENEGRPELIDYFTKRREELCLKLPSLETNYERDVADNEKLNAMLDKLMSDIAKLEAKAYEIKDKLYQARAKEGANLWDSSKTNF